MQKCNKIFNHPLYKECLKRISSEEKNRVFCLHNLEHSLDVARIGYIKILEDKLPIDKELFYAAALLHDAGRYTGKPHNESGADIASKILPDCGFSPQETEIVVNSISAHRKNMSTCNFARLLYYADKKSRMCMNCAAYAECYWENEKRNYEIEV